jgi:hypothetical protein
MHFRLSQINFITNGGPRIMAILIIVTYLKYVLKETDVDLLSLSLSLSVYGCTALRTLAAFSVSKSNI